MKLWNHQPVLAWDILGPCHLNPKRFSSDVDVVVSFVEKKEPQTWTGWWYTYPSEKYEFVSWDDDIPKNGKSENSMVPNHQSVLLLIIIYLLYWLVFIEPKPIGLTKDVGAQQRSFCSWEPSNLLSSIKSREAATKDKMSAAHASSLPGCAAP